MHKSKNLRYYAFISCELLFICMNFSYWKWKKGTSLVKKKINLFWNFRKCTILKCAFCKNQEKIFKKIDQTSSLFWHANFARWFFDYFLKNSLWYLGKNWKNGTKKTELFLIKLFSKISEKCKKSEKKAKKSKIEHLGFSHMVKIDFYNFVTRNVQGFFFQTVFANCVAKTNS